MGLESGCRPRPRARHGEIVAERAQRDRAALLVLPARPYLVAQRTTRKIARDGLFSFEGRRYLVRARPGDTVELRLAAEEIDVLRADTGVLLCRHERGRPARVLPDPKTSSRSLAQVLGALPAVEVHRRPLAAYQEAVVRG